VTVPGGEPRRPTRDKRPTRLRAIELGLARTGKLVTSGALILDATVIRAREGRPDPTVEAA